MRGRWWKLLGVAGIVGVAASGVVLARDERRRRAYTPEEVRSRLQERYSQVIDSQAGDSQAGDSQAGDSRASD